MRYPEFIKENDIIGITAPSDGIYEEDFLKLDAAKKNIEDMGFRCIETSNVRNGEKGRSSSGKERAEQLMDLWKNDEVGAIICAQGGDFLLEMMEHVDFKELKEQKPKWVQGYSDITGLGFILTTMFDIATIYCENIKDYAMKPLFKNLSDAIEIMRGNEVIQESFEQHEKPHNYYIESDKEKEKNEDITAQYELTERTEWKNLKGEKSVEFSGRAIGGCFDVIVNLFGSKYNNIKNYIEKYKNDGIVWFLEVYEMSTAQIYLYLLQMKQNGYFDNCNGIVFGRALMCREDYGITFSETVKDAIGELNIPIIYDADIGHVAPQMAIVNGAILNVRCKSGKGYVETKMI